MARLALGAIGIGAVLVLTRAALGPPGGTVDGLDGPGEAAGATWQRWSPQAQTGALSTGEPLFVDFTAAWCLSCQVNERVVLNTDEVRAGFAAHHVTLMKADWTRRDPAITRALSALGRSSVPVYALYPRGGGDPVLLPSVLTKDIVLDALDVHAPIPGSRASGAP